MFGRPSRLVAVSVVALFLAACDIGDGTTLRDPVAPTTLPPPDTTPLETLPLDDPTLDGAPLIDSIPSPTVPATDDGVASTDANTIATTGFRIFAPWADGAKIDPLYTCDGSNASPAIAWADVPAGTQELAISLVDETNLSNGRPFVHWVLAGLDPTLDRVGENEVPLGALQGLNFFGDVGYTGPCPNPDSTANYTITVFALNQQLELADGTPAAELLDVISIVTIDSASSVGSVTR